jgi:hypothetical protein
MIEIFVDSSWSSLGCFLTHVCIATAGKEIVRRDFDEAGKMVSLIITVDALYGFAKYMVIGESRDSS